jgi:CDP-glycerol glycerophosphotransferase (TagB/SpsB family)
MPSSCIELSELAEKTYRDFLARHMTVPAYSSANTAATILKRLPRHAGIFLQAAKRLALQQTDVFTEYSAATLLKEYLRKRKNLFRLPTQWMRVEPPTTPFVFFGLHMQPESSIDVWAPFYADQFNIIETIARSIPPSHRLLVKLHKSDADNYSRRQLDRLRRVPGVELVSPFVQSREFIEQSSLVITIQGTIGTEATLLGKPVIVFGESNLVQFPSVESVGAIHDLPRLVRKQLLRQPPAREAIIRALVSHLSVYLPGRLNDWEVASTAEELDALANQFRVLRSYVQSARDHVLPGA